MLLKGKTSERMSCKPSAIFFSNLADIPQNIDKGPFWILSGQRDLIKTYHNGGITKIALKNFLDFFGHKVDRLTKLQNSDFQSPRCT